MSTGKLLTGVIVGATAGAILGILLAPDKGSETRKKIAQKGSDLKGSVKDGISKLGDTISDKYESIKGDAKDLMDKGKEKAGEIKGEIKDDYKTENAF